MTSAAENKKTRHAANVTGLKLRTILEIGYFVMLSIWTVVTTMLAVAGGLLK